MTNWNELVTEAKAERREERATLDRLKAERRERSRRRIKRRRKTRQLKRLVDEGTAPETLRHVLALLD